MGIRKPNLPVALLSVLLLAGTACHSDKRQAKLPAPQANAPALAPLAAPLPQTIVDVKPDPDQQSQSAPQPKPDPVADLIASAEKDYQSAAEKFRAGDLEAAKRGFDRVVDQLLQSPPEVRADERVQHELERVLEGVNRPELAALQSDNPAAQQKAEPAPIDETNEITPPVDPNVKAQAEAEVKATRSELPLMLTDPVAAYINYFSNRGRDIIGHGLERGGRYRQMIEGILQQEGVPQELIYLAQAESGFHPLALSRVGARGMWQFMSSRAQGYGLQHNLWVDERQDPEKATRAAAHHLKDLYHQFGDWYLAMAAYNSGPGSVQSAVRRTGYADFWELYKRNVLPKETRNYVPIILAVTIMAKNPAQYGLDGIVPEQPVPYDTVKIDYSVDIRLVAQCVDVSPATLQDLNPSLLRLTTPKDQGFDLHLPSGTRDRYLSAIEPIPPQMRQWWRYHEVAQGDSLASLARTYRTSPEAIAKENHLENRDDLQADSKLIIPIPPGKHSATEDGASYARRAIRYKVRRGDTVQRVADNFSLPPIMIRRWNHLRGDSLRGRRIVYVHLPVTPNALSNDQPAEPKSKPKNSLGQASEKTVQHYKVQPGETLVSIATNHHTTVAALKRDNGNLAMLRPGMILVIREVQ
ncbi:MAG TPA: transglycosylase SLT domain-containing protein [Terriglobales bacterium]|jgi:membrane-bound lytic murein transglycosylase D|nr:transglycosylase SLT domain-containing protein [Terriglobales bacterium]